MRGRGRGGRAQPRGGRRGRGRARGRGQVRGAAVPLSQSYNDADQGNPPLQFQPARAVGVHLGRQLRNTMTQAVEFFNLFFTVQLIEDIVTHTNNYAYEHIMAGTHQSYAMQDGSWQETTADEIRKLIAILIYIGLVRVSDEIGRAHV